tara:strand:+ start:389 stop:583 length:195 start_codon:yes stop_codon:yes gene_type:complete
MTSLYTVYWKEEVHYEALIEAETHDEACEIVCEGSNDSKAIRMEHKINTETMFAKVLMELKEKE